MARATSPCRFLRPRVRPSLCGCGACASNKKFGSERVAACCVRPSFFASSPIHDPASPSLPLSRGPVALPFLAATTARAAPPFTIRRRRAPTRKVELGSFVPLSFFAKDSGASFRKWDAKLGLATRL